MCEGDGAELPHLPEHQGQKIVQGMQLLKTAASQFKKYTFKVRDLLKTSFCLFVIGTRADTLKHRATNGLTKQGRRGVGGVGKINGKVMSRQWEEQEFPETSSATNCYSSEIAVT